MLFLQRLNAVWNQIFCNKSVNLKIGNKKDKISLFICNKISIHEKCRFQSGSPITAILQCKTFIQTLVVLMGGNHSNNTHPLLLLLVCSLVNYLGLRDKWGGKIQSLWFILNTFCDGALRSSVSSALPCSIGFQSETIRSLSCLIPWHFMLMNA